PIGGMNVLIELGNVRSSAALPAAHLLGRTGPMAELRVPTGEKEFPIVEPRLGTGLDFRLHASKIRLGVQEARMDELLRITRWGHFSTGGRLVHLRRRNRGHGLGAFAAARP